MWKKEGTFIHPHQTQNSQWIERDHFYLDNIAKPAHCVFASSVWNEGIREADVKVFEKM